MKSIPRITLSLFALICIGATLLTSGTANAATPLVAPLLPGEPTLSGGASGVSNVPAYDFGVNNGIEYGNSTGTSGFAEDPNAQATVKSAGLGIDRIWAPYGAPGTLMDSTDMQWLTDHINGAKNSGATCYLEMGEVDNLPLLEQIVTTAEPLGCHIFEFGNEVDNNSGYSMTTYTNQWNADIPQLRALSVCAGTGSVSSGCLFGGPTVADPWDNMPYFFQNLNKTTAFPDFVSYHIYPCSGANAWDTTVTLDKEDCIQNLSTPLSQCTSNQNNCDYTSLPYMQQEVLGWEQQYLGKLLPTGVSETNWDPGTSTMTDWGNDDSWLSYYEQAATDTFVGEHASFAMTYTTEDSAGYGYLDILCDGKNYANDPACTATGAPKGEFVGLACEAAMYGAQSTFVAPAAVAADNTCGPKNIGTWPNWTFPTTAPTLSCPPDYTGDTNPTGWCEGEVGALEQSTSSFTAWYTNVYTPWSNGTGSISCPPDFAGDTFGYANYCFGEIGALEGQASGAMSTWLATVYDPYAAFYGYQQ